MSDPSSSKDQYQKQTVTAYESMLTNMNNTDTKSNPPPTHRRVTKSEAGYVQHKTQCASCKFFNGSHRSCALVKGDIDPNHCCNLWTSHGTCVDLKYLSGGDIEDLLGSDRVACKG